MAKEYHHSCRIASIGESRAALNAGYIPKTMPTMIGAATETANVPIENPA
jgi:hypothetical protein